MATNVLKIKKNRQEKRVGETLNLANKMKTSFELALDEMITVKHILFVMYIIKGRDFIMQNQKSQNKQI